MELKLVFIILLCNNPPETYAEKFPGQYKLKPCQIPFLASICAYFYHDTYPMRKRLAVGAVGTGIILNKKWILAPGSVTAAYEPYGIDGNRSLTITVGWNSPFFPEDTYSPVYKDIEINSKTAEIYKVDMAFVKHYEVQMVVLHKQFKFTKGKDIRYARTAFDISLIKTATPIQFNQCTKPVNSFQHPLSGDPNVLGDCRYINYGCTSLKVGYIGCNKAELLSIPIKVIPTYCGDPFAEDSKRILGAKPTNPITIPRKFPQIPGGVLKCKGQIVGIGICYDCLPFGAHYFIYPDKISAFSLIRHYRHFISYTLGYNCNHSQSDFYFGREKSRGYHTSTLCSSCVYFLCFYLYFYMSVTNIDT